MSGVHIRFNVYCTVLVLQNAFDVHAVLFRVWFGKIGANVKILKTDTPDLMFLSILALLVSYRCLRGGSPSSA